MVVASCWKTTKYSPFLHFLLHVIDDNKRYVKVVRLDSSMVMTNREPSSRRYLLPFEFINVFVFNFHNFAQKLTNW